MALALTSKGDLTDASGSLLKESQLFSGPVHFPITLQAQL